MAAAHHARLSFEGLYLQGVDLLTRWAGPDIETHEVLLLLAMFERVSRLVLDATSGEWIRQGTDTSASASSGIFTRPRFEPPTKRSPVSCITIRPRLDPLAIGLTTVWGRVCH